MRPWPLANPATLNRRQKKIRDMEWACVEKYLAAHSPGRFLDVGCGTGYALKKAHELGFTVTGIDPAIGVAGVVCREVDDMRAHIVEGNAEDLPFGDESFDVVYSSHALEHFVDRDRGVAEMRRVLAREGIMICIVPTATMAFIRIISQYVFASHLRLAAFLLRSRTYRRCREIIIPPPHGDHARSCFGELQDFSVRHWRSMLECHFSIEEVLLPALYPYPDLPQFFPMVKLHNRASSVVFVARHPMCRRI